MVAMDAESITLDKSTFKALASENRIAILKSLDKRRKTASELSHELGTTVQGISEHLQSLQQAGLVERQENERKWVYYNLTGKGSAVLHPDSKKFWVLVSLSLLALSTYFYSPTLFGERDPFASLGNAQATVAGDATPQAPNRMVLVTPAPLSASNAEPQASPEPEKQIGRGGQGALQENAKSDSLAQTQAFLLVVASLLLAGAGWIKFVKKRA